MSDIAIRVEGLSKRYQLGEKDRYRTLRDALTDAATIPFRRLRGGTSPKEVAETLWALKNVSFEVKHGEVIGIIGRNGAGKSTLLKVLSRITEPSEGRVEIHGRIGSLLEVGTGFHPELSGRENIFLNGAILGMKRAEILRKFDEIVAFAEVEKFIDTPVKRFSSGMYVRLAFAVAAHMETEILIVDEVLSVGDAAFQKKCMGKMSDVSKHGRTIIFVSHNTAAIQSLCSAGILLDSGKLRRAGPIGSIIGEYLISLERSDDSRQNRVIQLGPDLSLDRIDFESSTIQSGGPLSLQAELMPLKESVVKEMALLVYSEYGVRVAIFDLRNSGFADLRIATQSLQFELHIPVLPLVEGRYRVGFYVATNEYAGDYLDVAEFHVTAPQERQGAIPYPAQVRGVIEVEFSAQMHMAKTISVV